MAALILHIRAHIRTFVILLLCVYILFYLFGCARPKPSVVPLAPDVLDAARDSVLAIVQALPSFLADSLAKFEQPKIRQVQRDIASIQDETDDARFVEKAGRLREDWGVLVALDNKLQKESLT